MSRDLKYVANKEQNLGEGSVSMGNMSIANVGKLSLMCVLNLFDFCMQSGQ